MTDPTPDERNGWTEEQRDAMRAMLHAELVTMMRAARDAACQARAAARDVAAENCIAHRTACDVTIPATADELAEKWRHNGQAPPTDLAKRVVDDMATAWEIAEAEYTRKPGQQPAPRIAAAIDSACDELITAWANGGVPDPDDNTSVTVDAYVRCAAASIARWLQRIAQLPAPTLLRPVRGA